MSNQNKKTDKQLSLFDFIKSQKDPLLSTRIGFLKIQSQYEQILSNDISKSKFSRYEIVARMSEFLDQEITIHMLNSWTAESKEKNRQPAIFVPAFCVSVESFNSLNFLAKKVGRFLMPGPEALRVEIQKNNEKIESLKQENEKMLFFLKGTPEKGENE